MPPTCAACLQPLVGGQFVIAETEVLHKACARQPHTTALWLARQGLADALSKAVHDEQALAAARLAHSRVLAIGGAARGQHRREITELRDAMARLRADLAAQQALAAERLDQLTKLQGHTTAQTAETDVDPVAARFGLLELD